MSGKPVTNKQSSDDQVRKKNYSIKKGEKNEMERILVIKRKAYKWHPDFTIKLSPLMHKLHFQIIVIQPPKSPISTNLIKKKKTKEKESQLD